MIVVDIMLHHAAGGSPTRLGSVEIVNTGEGTLERGTYRATVIGNKSWPVLKVRVEDFPRKELLAHDLLYRVLREAFGDRNEC